MPGHVDDVRDLVAKKGASALVVDDLRASDLALLGWSGSARHVIAVGEALARVPSGSADYLVVRAPAGEPVAKGGIDHVDPRGPGKIWQLATHPELQSLGIGAVLIRALEERIRTRGITVAWLGVELDNPRARALYERLGYLAFDEEESGWEQQDAEGNLSWYATRLTLMRRDL